MIAGKAIITGLNMCKDIIMGITIIRAKMATREKDTTSEVSFSTLTAEEDLSAHLQFAVQAEVPENVQAQKEAAALDGKHSSVFA